MADRIIQSEYDRSQFIKFLQGHKLPCTVTVTEGKHRSTRQNKLQRLWTGEIADQIDGWTREEVRAYCKLHHGVPILRDENEAFRLRYDDVVKPLDYEQKLALMAVPLDMPVTRIMSTKQKARYLDTIYRDFAERGLSLTSPDDFMAGRRFENAA